LQDCSQAFKPQTKNGSLAFVLKELSDDYLGDQSNVLKGSSTGVSAK